MRGKCEYTSNSKASGNNTSGGAPCSFELEVCLVPCVGGSSNASTKPSTPKTPSRVFSKTPNTNKTPNNSNKSTPNKATGITSSTVVGIRRKRLKGDSWRYKNVCEEVLALAAIDLNTKNNLKPNDEIEQLV